jgi:hypothetical protein
MDVSGQFHALAALPLKEKNSLYPLVTRFGRHQGWSVRCGEEKNILPLPKMEPRLVDCPVCGLVGMPIDIFFQWLLQLLQGPWPLLQFRYHFLHRR